MKKDILKNLGQVVVAVTLAVAGSSSFAVSNWSINLNENCGGGTSTTDHGTLGSTIGCNGTSASAQMSGWTTSGSTYSSATIVESTLKDWGSNGFGVQNSTDTNHSMDNSGTTDMILLKFSQTVTLTSLQMGWWSNDSDMSLLAYSGDDGVSNSTIIAGATLGSLVNQGWTLIDHYADVQLNNTTVNTATPQVSSSWWLVSAYNKYYDSSSAIDKTADYMKLLKVAGTVGDTPPSSNGVPEPGSLALMGAAMMGFVASRRRKQQAA